MNPFVIAEDEAFELIVENSVECFLSNQEGVFSDLFHHEQHFKEIYEKYKKEI